jgi:hypothetical protein
MNNNTGATIKIRILGNVKGTGSGFPVGILVGPWAMICCSPVARKTRRKMNLEYALKRYFIEKGIMFRMIKEY